MDIYKSPLTERYTSLEIQKLFSPKKRHVTWRKMWVALAKTQKQLGLQISDEQIKELEDNLEDIDFAKALEFEKKCKHDVMAHVYTYGEQCPKAKPIIHLGATSCFVTDNADLMILKEGLLFLLAKLEKLIKTMCKRANDYKDLACLSYTHFQAAQPTTLGKRISIWLQDFVWDTERLLSLIDTLPFLGAKGTTGTQASFLKLHGNEASVEELDQLLAKECGFEGKELIISGQTYPRKLDTYILEALSGIAVSAHKFGVDLRLLSHTKEVYEKFEEGQVGSSAMPYKKNPIRSERLCALSRFTQSLSLNGLMTASTQWLERSLDDSANRRLVLPEAFLSVDAVLNLCLNLSENFVANEEKINELLNAEMAHMITENILMESVKKGADRQSLHEKLKNISHANALSENPLETLIQIVAKDKNFPLTHEELNNLIDTSSLVGRAPSQVKAYQNQTVNPLLKRVYSLNLHSPSPTLIM